MAVRIRLMRLGRRHRPFFRINAMDSRVPRNGRILEKLGHYDPIEQDPDKQLVLDLDKVKAWLDKGAHPTDGVIPILRRVGITCSYMEEKEKRRLKAKAIARKAGKPFNTADRVALAKAADVAAKAAEEAAAAAKAAAEAKAKAAADAAAAAAADAETDAS